MAEDTQDCRFLWLTVALPIAVPTRLGWEPLLESGPFGLRRSTTFRPPTTTALPPSSCNEKENIMLSRDFTLAVSGTVRSRGTRLTVPLVNREGRGTKDIISSTRPKAQIIIKRHHLYFVRPVARLVERRTPGCEEPGFETLQRSIHR